MGYLCQHFSDVKEAFEFLGEHPLYMKNFKGYIFQIKRKDTDDYVYKIGQSTSFMNRIKAVTSDVKTTTKGSAYIGEIYLVGNDKEGLPKNKKYTYDKMRIENELHELFKAFLLPQKEAYKWLRIGARRETFKIDNEELLNCLENQGYLNTFICGCELDYDYEDILSIIEHY